MWTFEALDENINKSKSWWDIYLKEKNQEQSLYGVAKG